MNTSIVIFASGDVGILAQRLKIGTPNLELIEGDIVTEEIQAQMKEGAPKQFDYNLPLKRVRLSNELMQGLIKPTEIIIIDTKKCKQFLAVYKQSADTYSERLSVINLTIRNGNVSDHSKEVFLIKGNDYKLLKGIITKVFIPPPPPQTAAPEVLQEYEKVKSIPPQVSAGIELETIEELENAAITEVTKDDLSLLTINTNPADDTSRAFLKRLSERKSFAVVSIESTEEITIEPEESEIPEDSASQAAASDLEDHTNTVNKEKVDTNQSEPSIEKTPAVFSFSSAKASSNMSSPL
jgi:hypothetical protein